MSYEKTLRLVVMDKKRNLTSQLELSLEMLYDIEVRSRFNYEITRFLQSTSVICTNEKLTLTNGYIDERFKE